MAKAASDSYEEYAQQRKCALTTAYFDHWDRGICKQTGQPRPADYIEQLDAKRGDAGSAEAESVKQGQSR